MILQTVYDCISGKAIDGIEYINTRNIEDMDVTLAKMEARAFKLDLCLKKLEDKFKNV